WLNADDIYLPGTLIKVCRVFQKKNADLVTGGIVRNSAASVRNVVIGRAAEYGVAPTLGLFFVSAPLLHQSSTFWTSSIWRDVGGALNEQLHYAMDADLWVRFLKTKRVRSRVLDSPLSLFRAHNKQKTRYWEDYERELDMIKNKHFSNERA